MFQADEIIEVAKSDGFTVVGLLMAFNLISISVAVYLYKSKDKLYKDYINELKTQNEIIIRMNNSYNEFGNGLKEAFKTKV